MEPNILVTLGPSSLNKETIEAMEKEQIYLFRINLSHTPLSKVEEVILEIKQYTDTPICVDSEGAQIRNHSMKGNGVEYRDGAEVKIYFEEVLGDQTSISLYPDHVAKQLRAGDRISVDFDSVVIKVIETYQQYCVGIVEEGGRVGSNKAANVDREIELEAISAKDREAIKIGRGMGIEYFALSFANSVDDVQSMRELVGEDASIISKVESRNGLKNLRGILDASNEILIDRGDLSRQVSLVKIPFFQRRIISTARSKGKPVYVATNLLESMINNKTPTRAEINDVVSTLQMGANGLVLAAETAVGKYPLESVKNIRELIEQFKMWTPNTSIDELLEE